MSRNGWLFLCAYTASGFAGLVYEVSWTRLLTLYMGHTTSAASTVVAAFMGGLALGAALGGRFASEWSPRRALRAYLGLELLVVVAALTLPLELRALSPLLAWAYADGAPGLLFPAVRLGACLVALLIPAMALGATFPMAVRWFVGRSVSLGRFAGALYAANTSGAALGALVAGFFLLPAVGLSATVWVGIAGSLSAVVAVAVVAHDDASAGGNAVDTLPRPPLPVLPASAKSGRSRRRRESSAPAPATATLRPQWLLAAAVLGLTGFATLTYEIAWMRVFALTSGPSTYAFAGVVAAVITGLAIGSIAGSALAGRFRRPALLLGAVLALTALGALLAGGYAGSGLPRAIATQLASAAPEAVGLERVRAWLLLKLVVPIAVGLGITFPLALQLGGGARHDSGVAASRVAAVYAVNAISAVAGALVTGFLTIHWLGLQRTLGLATGVLAGCVLLVAFFGALRRPSRLGLAVAAGVALFGLAVQPPWDRALLASGVYKYAPLVAKDLDLEAALTAGTLIYYRDGAAATVSVKRLTGELSLSVDGKVDASTSIDMLTQKALAHLPLLLHPNPRAVAVIGLGSGVTVASALVHPIASVDVVEIAPEVVEASRLFAEQNRRALDDPRTRLVIGDGRSHLQLSARQYDVIISEPSNPWMAGIAALFTREFLVAARARLTPEGVMCQWAHTYGMSEADLRSIVATFASVFPNGTLWLMGEGDLLLVGSASPDPIRLTELSVAWQRPGVAADLQTVGGAEPFAFLSSYIAGPDEVRRYAAGAPVQTDDRMALEFSAPRALYQRDGDTMVTTLRALLDVATAPPPVAQAWASATAVERRHRAEMLFKAGAYAAAWAEYVVAFSRDPVDADTPSGLVRAAVAAHQEARARALFDQAVASHPTSVPLGIARSKLLAAAGLLDQAVEAAQAASAVAPPSAAAVEQLASIYADAGAVAGLAIATATLRQLAPGGRGAQYYTAALQFLRQDFVPAAQSARAAVAVDPQYAPARNLLGAILASLGRNDEARDAFHGALKVDPRDPAIYTNLARLESSTGHDDIAAGLYAEALSLDPSWESAREGLAKIEHR